MRSFDYQKEATRLLTHSSVGKIGVAYEFIGKKRLLQDSAPHLVETLQQTTLLHTVAAGVRSNGITLSFQRIKDLVSHTAGPQSEVEHSVVRYARALTTISGDGYDHTDMMADIIRLNNLLFYDDLDALQCQWRVHNTPFRSIEQTQPYVHTLPPHTDAPKMFARICEEYATVMAEGVIHPFYAMSIFFLDFIAIQPFDRGNYEMVRLVLAYLMNWAGFPMMDTISMEHCLLKHMHGKSCIAGSLTGWDQGENDYSPVFGLCMDLIQEAQDLLSQWSPFLLKGSIAPKDIVLKVIQLSCGNLTKRMIAEYIPFMGESSIESALYSLKREGLISKIGGGRYSKYSYLPPSHAAGAD